MARMNEGMIASSGVRLQIEREKRGEGLEVLLKLDAGEACVLHWGIRKAGDNSWHAPAREMWPDGTQPYGNAAVRSPFPEGEKERGLRIRAADTAGVESIEFALFLPERNRWLNNGGKNYRITIAPARRAGSGLEEGLLPRLRGPLFQRVYELEPGRRLAVGVSRQDGEFSCEMMTDFPGKVVLHWGIAEHSSDDWRSPLQGSLPAGTISVSESAAETVFQERSDGLKELRLAFAEAEAPMGIPFVLKQLETGRWIKDGGRNFFVPINSSMPPGKAFDSEELKELADEIIQAETGRGSWTLMHRFNLCHELLSRAGHDREALALLFVWLRFSAIRQLTWQRNYNTKPRELSHAQDRLTHKLAELHTQAPEGRSLIRLMLGSVGRGGEGQRIRDEILVIMHRHHIKEVSGHFLEEWHQKLHNNTTPDDIVICEAYLEFLSSNGQLNKFYERLQAGGVSKSRLESFERPIKSNPDFVPHLKDALIHDFGNFLRVLKSVHAGTDLETAIHSAQPYISQGAQNSLWEVWNQRRDSDLVRNVRRITQAREQMGHPPGGPGARELLYADLALEELLRAVFERNLERAISGDELVELTGLVLKNLLLSEADGEFALCMAHWNRLKQMPRFGRDWSLHAKSVTDRIGRALSAEIDRTYQLLQPKAERLGAGFQAEAWTISLFSEEVVRGSSLSFVLSKLLHRLDPLLRKSSGLGVWQIVSRGRGTGEVELVDSLRAIQGKRFNIPKIIVADKVTGEEEIPEGVVAVVAPDVTDLVSHVAVRARNAGLLFATCFDSAVLQQLKNLRGRAVELEVNTAGDVVWSERMEPSQAVAHPKPLQVRRVTAQFSQWALTLQEFNEEQVGGKSLNQARLRGRLPASIRQPASVALPFGVFDQVLALEQNKTVAERYQALQQEVDQDRARKLAQLRGTVLELSLPAGLAEALGEKMQQAGLEKPSDWQQAWRRICQVWASKWNERAYLSRVSNGISHESLLMAVLIQQVVPAEYAFVLHTVNPSTGNADELYGEVVLGLGETLVGNHPGRSLSFTWNKRTREVTLLSYPGKSLGLYGSGLIFRSDSNGEDLAGYAGAGLYDSVLLNHPTERRLDYAQEPLVWDESFRRRVLTSIAEMGRAVAESMGSPQDIEGAWTQEQAWLVQTRPQVGVQNG